MRCAVVKDGVVVNVIVVPDDADAEFFASRNAVLAPDDAGIGDLFDGEAFTRPLEN